jgi:hypothetical protein
VSVLRYGGEACNSDDMESFKIHLSMIKVELQLTFLARIVGLQTLINTSWRHANNRDGGVSMRAH